GTVASDSIGFGAFINELTLDKAVTLASAGHGWNWGGTNFYNLGTIITGTDNEAIIGGALQVGGTTSVSYSRFGTDTTSHGSMSAANDLLISGDFEVNGSAAFDGHALFGTITSMSDTLEISRNGTTSSLLKLTDTSVPTARGTVGLTVNDGDFQIRFASATATAFANDRIPFSIASNSLATTIGTPASPSLIGAYDPSDTVTGVYVSGKYAYVADAADGLRIIDISNPASPSLKSSYDTDGSSEGLYVSGKYAYVADGGVGLKIFDVSNASAPVLKGSVAAGGGVAREIYVSGKYAYLAAGTPGLYIIDISNPSTPSVVGIYNTSGEVYDVYVSGRYAYVADSGSGLQIIDISNPSTPNRVGNYNPGGNTFGVYVSGKYAYLGTGGAGLRIVDISNPLVPVSKGVYNTPGSSTYVYVSGKYAYVADGAAGGLQIIDISNPSALTSRGSYDTPGTVMDVYVAGRYAYVADSVSGLMIFDVGGLETHALYAGNIEANDITISENLDVGNDLLIRGGAIIGPGGLLVGGRLGIDLASLSSNIASTSSDSVFRVNHQKGYLSGDIFNVNVASVSAANLFSGNFARFTYANSDRIIMESSGAILASGAVTFGSGGAPTSAAYSRFGTSTATHTNYMTAANDVMVSSDLYVVGSISANIASASSYMGEAFNSIASDCTGSNFIQWTRATGKFGCAAGGGSVASNSLGFGAFINELTLDKAVTLASAGFTWNWGGTNFQNVGSFATGTNDEAIIGGTLQVGGTASVGYSRFGTTATTHGNYISQSNDLLISGDLEVVGTASFAIASASHYFGSDMDDQTSVDIIDYGGGRFLDFSKIVAFNKTSFFRVGGTGYINATGQINVGSGLASVSYNRFGNQTTFNGEWITSANDVLISEDLEVIGSISANIASASAFMGGAFNAISGDCTGSNFIQWTRNTGKFGCALGGGSIASDSMGFGAWIASLTLDTYTEYAVNGNQFSVNLTGAGDFTVQDNGAIFWTFLDTGGVSTSEEFNIDMASSRSFVVGDGGGVSQDVFTINTLTSASNPGLDIVATGMTSAGTSALTITVPASTSSAGRLPHGALWIVDSLNNSLASMSNEGSLALRGYMSARAAYLDCSLAPSKAHAGKCLDYAESYPTMDKSIEAGDIVAIDEKYPEFVIKAKQGSSVLGIVSSNPGMLLTGSSVLAGDYDGKHKKKEGSVPVALAGRVPLKVSIENGRIEAGDSLTLSSVPGVAMKATAAGERVGKAMDGFKDKDPGSIIAYVNLSYFAGLGDAGIASQSLNFTGPTPTPTPTPTLTPTPTPTPSPDVRLDEQIVRIDGLEVLVAEHTMRIASLSQGFDGLATAVNGLASGSFDRLNVQGKAIFGGGLTVDSIGSNGNSLVFNSDIEFFGRPYFNYDTGGFAIITEGATHASVSFENEYLNQPIVNAAISLNAASTSELDELLLFDGDIRYIVTNKSTKGFTIKLNKPAPTDVQFSWIALAVKDAKTFFSPIVVPQPIPTPTPTPTPSLTPTPSTTPDPSPTPTPSSTPDPSPTPTPSTTPDPSPTPTPSSTPDPSPTPTPTLTPTPTPSTTPDPSPTPTPSITPVPTPDPNL
ncbi:MAG: hypothetical protein AAB420_02090, partial [Patescibacteria group bacterium]